MRAPSRALKVIAVALTAAQLSACGTILYPERKGQIDGRVDPGVAVLDAVGLLFFIIPGVIAFAVDFSNGTIYLPGGRRGGHRRFLSLDELRRIRFDKRDGLAGAERIVSRQAGVPIDATAPGVEVERLSSTAQMLALFSRRRRGPTRLTPSRSTASGPLSTSASPWARPPAAPPSMACAPTSSTTTAPATRAASTLSTAVPSTIRWTSPRA